VVLDAQPVATPTAARPDPSARAPRVAEGVELIGEYEGSGFKETPYLARRADGQTIQLSKLLYSVAQAADGRRTYDEIAGEASRTFGRRLSARNAKTLIEKLNNLGVVANDDGSQPVMSKPDSLLALQLRKGVISPRMVKALTTVFYPAFFPPVILGALGALAVFDWWLFTQHGVAQGVRQTVMHPTLFLALFGLVIVSAFLHEVGHATGLRYGGGEPGVMGAGVYIAFPAFYTDVTDAYRLSKGGRLRTDLGGVYFNALFMLATAGAYFATHFEPLLFLILVQHIEMAHQFLPFLRLDGYYIVADAVGVPDLFTRIGPILRSMVPWRRSDPRVKELKPWVRLFVTAWVLVVVPFLLFNLTLLLVHLPRLLGTGMESVRQQGSTARAAFADGSWLVGVGGGLQMLILLLPFVGIVYTFARLGMRIGRRSWAWSAESYAKRASVLVVGTGLLGLLVWAWLPGRQYAPIEPGERGTFTDYVASSETILRSHDTAPAFVPGGTADAIPANGPATAPDGAPAPVPSGAPGGTAPGAGTTGTTGTTGGTSGGTPASPGTAGGGTSPQPSPQASTAPSDAPSASPTPTPTPTVTP
jgi:putative peptide zinc metalloprotease protein